jgi:hypothetical protein
MAKPKTNAQLEIDNIFDEYRKKLDEIFKKLDEKHPQGVDKESNHSIENKLQRLADIIAPKLPESTKDS